MDESSNPKFPHRRRPARQSPLLRFNHPTIIYVTVCTADRKKILANGEVHEAVRKAFAEADHWMTGLYVIMPDHIHFFCAPSKMDCAPIKIWIKYWKRCVSTNMGWSRGSWLMDGWDTQIRHGDDYSQKWWYVYENPVRHGLVERPEDWPYSGEMNDLMWI